MLATREKLARRVVIKNIKQQREYIKSKLKAMTKKKTYDGDPSLVYLGYIYLDVIDYLKEEGFEVIKYEGNANTRYLPAYLIVPELYLSKEEEKLADSEKYEDVESEILQCNSPNSTPKNIN